MSIFTAQATGNATIDIAAELAVNLNAEQAALMNKLITILETRNDPTVPPIQQYQFTLSPNNIRANVNIASPGPCKIKHIQMFSYGVPPSAAFIVFERIIGNTKASFDLATPIFSYRIIAEDILVPSNIVGTIYTEGTTLTGEVSVFITLEPLEYWK
jgi:hypothetical protein